MIEKSSDLPSKKFRNQKRAGHPSPDLRRVLQESMNQLTIMNFSCSKFRGAVADLTDHSIHSIAMNIEKMEKTIVDMAALVESVSQAMKSTPLQSAWRVDGSVFPSLSCCKSEVIAGLANVVTQITRLVPRILGPMLMQG